MCEPFTCIKGTKMLTNEDLDYSVGKNRTRKRKKREGSIFFFLTSTLSILHESCL